jgi:hypothetical protein
MSSIYDDNGKEVVIVDYFERSGMFGIEVDKRIELKRKEICLRTHDNSWKLSEKQLVKTKRGIVVVIATFER